MRIALDAMGGDRAPHVVVEGALLACQVFPHVELILVGNEDAIRACLPSNVPPSVTIRSAKEVIGAEEEPAMAIRRKKDSSLVVAVRMMCEGEADAVLTAGNTGAFMAAGMLLAGRMPGVSRPALGPILPTHDRRGVLVLDGGANMDAKPEHLTQYAWMGHCYAKVVTGIAEPRVGLLNVGTEPSKGNELSKCVYPLLQSMPLNFVGNVEARDIPHGGVDVLICDGFAGNILLKSIEGTAEFMMGLLRKELTSTLMGRMGAWILRNRFRKLKEDMNYNEYGGAPLLGVQGVMMKCHGSSDLLAIKNGIGQAVKAVQNQLVESIRESLREGDVKNAT